MRYSALKPGKCFRSALVYATGKMLNVEPKALDNAAVAIELIHTYSLIHDDLPCMDDDHLRRGIPSCHIQFDEATAILTGDALQTLAFDLLSSSHKDEILSDHQRLSMLALLAKASGSFGMGGGQMIDLVMTNASQKRAHDLQTLEKMHQMKTGALINASVEMGFLASQCLDQVVLCHLRTFSQHLGLAFQIRDDILDIESDTISLGKPQGSDMKSNKLTFPAILGLDGAKRHAKTLIEIADDALNRLPFQTELLAGFSHYVIQRKT
jgi:farnesyl diphosphate synthase